MNPDADAALAELETAVSCLRALLEAGELPGLLSSIVVLMLSRFRCDIEFAIEQVTDARKRGARGHRSHRN